MGACLSLLRRQPKENTDASVPVAQEAKTAVTRADEEFLHRVTREDSLKHLVRHPRIHPFSSADKFGFNGAYESVKLLGRGGTGATWLCKDMKALGKLVAIKLQQRPIPESSVKTTYNEIIVQGNESEGCIFATTIREVVLTPQYLGLVLEYENGGTLAEYVASRVGKVGPLDLAVPEAQALYFFKQLVAGVSYLHKHHTAHRDIKLDNTLLNADNPMQPPTLKLADFQFCYFWGPSERIKSISHLGTPVYMSPELLQVRFKNYGRHSYDPVTADVWACAVLLVATLTGAFPFDNRPGASVEEAEKEILDQQLNRPWHKSRFIEPYISKLSAECIDLLNKMLVVDPANRISLSAVEQHPWMSTALPEDLDSAWVRLLKEQEGAATRANHVKIDKVALQERDDSIWELVNEAASTRTDHVASRKAKWPFEDLTSIPGGWRIDMKLAAVQAND